MRAYSSDVRPCSAASCGVTLISLWFIWVLIESQETTRSRRNSFGGTIARKIFDHRAQDDASIDRTKTGFYGAFRMRHQTDDIAFAIAHSCDGCERTIRIGLEIV